MASINLQQTVVKLNVGGVRFETSLSTLTRYPESMFAIWFANWNAESKEEYFIDFDGSVFKIVLEFLRYGEAFILPKEEHCLESLLLAADYFQLPRLQALIQQKLHKEDKKGLSGEALEVSAVVKLSSYGVAAVADSFVAYSLAYLPPFNGVHLLGRLYPRPISASNPGALGVCCPSCLNTTQHFFTVTLELQHLDAVKTHRDFFADQLKLAEFNVSSVGTDDCVFVTSSKHFGGKSFHVAKSFLCAA